MSLDYGVQSVIQSQWGMESICAWSGHQHLGAGEASLKPVRWAAGKGRVGWKFHAVHR